MINCCLACAVSTVEIPAKARLTRFAGKAELARQFAVLYAKSA